MNTTTACPSCDEATMPAFVVVVGECPDCRAKTLAMFGGDTA